MHTGEWVLIRNRVQIRVLHICILHLYTCKRNMINTRYATRKHVLSQTRTTNAQIKLHIHSFCSASFLFIEQIITRIPLVSISEDTADSCLDIIEFIKLVAVKRLDARQRLAFYLLFINSLNEFNNT